MTIQANQGFGVSIFGATSAGGGGSTSPGGSSGQVQYNNGGSFGGMSGTTWTDASQSLAIASTGTGTGITASTPVLNLSQTWNAGAVTFTGLKFNAATGSNANSAAGSLLLDLQLETASKFSVTKSGNVAASGVGYFLGIKASNAASSVGVNGIYADSNGVQIASGTFLSWVNTSNPETGTADLFLRRAAAATLQLGAADAAGSAIAINSVASNQLTLASSHGLSNGAAVIITGTAAPSGTSLNTLYYARSISAAVLELYDTYQNAITTSGTTGRVSVTTAGTSASVRLSTPFQTFQPQSFTGTDIPGQPFIINGSRGTGTGAGGSIIFQVAPAVTTGSAQNAYSTALTITSSGAYPIVTEYNLQVKNNIRITGGNANISGNLGNITLGDNSDNYAVTISGAANTGITLKSSLSLRWTDGTSYSGTADLFLYRDAANTLALRNGTNAQKFRVYNTYTSGTNYENFEIDWQTTANIALVGPTKGSGGGTQRVQRLSYLEDGGTGSTTPSLGTTCPAASATIKSWIKVITSDGTTAYIPCWA